MKISIASDVHLEFGALSLTNSDQSDVLVLAGDIFVAEHFRAIERSHVSATDQFKVDKVIDFFDQINQEWDDIILIFGNHEYYGETLTGGRPEQVLREHCDTRNVHILNPGHIDLKGVRFIGATLWTNFNNGDPLAMWEAKRGMNDFNFIWDRNDHPILPAQILDVHRAELDIIKQWVEDGNRPERTVVVSHHAPSILSIQDEYKSSELSLAFYSRLEEFILDHPQIDLWIHGHTHYSTEYYIGETRIVSNQRGYRGIENMAKTFELKTVEV